MYAILLAVSPIVSLLDINETTLQEFAQGNISECILECPAGASLPFTIDVKGEFVSFHTTSRLDILQTCYLHYLSKDQILFSTDLKEWKNFPEFFTGEARAFLRVENDIPQAGLELEANQRK